MREVFHQSVEIDKRSFPHETREMQVSFCILHQSTALSNVPVLRQLPCRAARSLADAIGISYINTRKRDCCKEYKRHMEAAKTHRFVAFGCVTSAASSTIAFSRLLTAAVWLDGARITVTKPINRSICVRRRHSTTAPLHTLQAGHHLFILRLTDLFGTASACTRRLRCEVGKRCP